MKLRLRLSLPLLLSLLFVVRCVANAQQPSPPLKAIRVNGVVLHYIDQGHGPAVVFVHGGMEDYRAWEAQFAPLSKHFRLIAVSAIPS